MKKPILFLLLGSHMPNSIFIRYLEVLYAIASMIKHDEVIIDLKALITYACPVVSFQPEYGGSWEGCFIALLPSVQASNALFLV